jgi:hypothetical protein
MTCCRRDESKGDAHFDAFGRAFPSAQWACLDGGTFRKLRIPGLAVQGAPTHNLLMVSCRKFTSFSALFSIRTVVPL